MITSCFNISGKKFLIATFDNIVDNPASIKLPEPGFYFINLFNSFLRIIEKDISASMLYRNSKA